MAPLISEVNAIIRICRRLLKDLDRGDLDKFEAELQSIARIDKHKMGIETTTWRLPIN